METALSHHTRTVLQDNWEVGNGATTTVIPVTLANPGGKAVDITGQVSAELAGATIEFVSGLNLGASRNVLSATSTGTLTLDTALATAPAQGDRFVLMRAVRLEVTAPENITQVGSQNVPNPDIPRVPVVGYNQQIPAPYTTTPLIADASYDSASFNLIGFSIITGGVFSDQSGSLEVQQSPDGTNWDVLSTFAVTGGTGQGFSVEIVYPFGRIVYTNGATAQTIFRLYSFLKRFN